ncbi:hypothetical protein CDAR_514981 [Caerostris darwini]|uniref:Uncharacterized protein n=1 Tax=Caerostris darwini TaxID=1538125 RepID=A0AAV4WY50_9ARAC|nr:hypothetical protein CDAR_514981 [Caerostris darwini]
MAVLPCGANQAMWQFGNVEPMRQYGTNDTMWQFGNVEPMSRKPEKNVFFSDQNDLAVDKKMSSPVGRWSFPDMRSRITTRGTALDKQHYTCSRLDASNDGSCKDHDAVSSTSALLSSSVFSMSPSLVEWVSWLIA